MKPFDLSKFRTGISKSITGISFGFSDPKYWVSTGSYGLNYRISGDFEKGVPLGKVTVFAGESGSGKSYIVSGLLTANAQKQGIHVIMIDTEHALDEEWLKNAGVDTSPEKLEHVSMSQIDDVSKYIYEFVKFYKDIPEDNRPKVMFVIDSLGMLLTPTEINQFQKGDTSKGDMGRKAKALKAFVTNCVNMLGNLDIGMVCTNHTYASQDMFSPDPKVSGGSGFVYASSIMVAMGKLNLKENEDGDKVSKVEGIRSKCKTMKTRFTKPFESIELKIPYRGGLDPYSGLFDMFKEYDLFERNGNKYRYVDIETGEEYNHFEKAWNKNTDGALDVVMKQFDKHPKILEKFGRTSPEVEEELDAPEDDFFDEISEEPEE